MSWVVFVLPKIPQKQSIASVQMMQVDLLAQSMAVVINNSDPQVVEIREAV
jgi:hypothetical protein